MRGIDGVCLGVSRNGEHVALKCGGLDGSSNMQPAVVIGGGTNPFVGNSPDYNRRLLVHGNIAISTGSIITVDQHYSSHGFMQFNGSGNGQFRLYGYYGGRLESSGGVALYWTYDTNRVGIKTQNPDYDLEVNGTFAATSKSFIIDHPTKEDKKLRHGALEGPEHAVYVRGKSTDTVIELPEYWTKLVDEDSITVQLTAIGGKQDLWVEDVINNTVIVGHDPDGASLKYFYFIQGERIDIDKLEVEVDK